MVFVVCLLNAVCSRRVASAVVCCWCAVFAVRRVCVVVRCRLSLLGVVC